MARADPVSAYARGVVSSKIPACKFVKLACKRHLSDLAKFRAKKSKFYFDKELAKKAIDFYPLLKHSKGEWAGQPFDLSGFQEFCEGSIEGWRRREDGLRRFRNAYIEIPRKNGKTTWAAGRAIKSAFADREPGAEVYVAATKRDQAKLAWEEARRMVLATPALKKKVTILRGVSNLNIAEKGQKLEPLGADADTLDGLNIHAAVIDEVHAHKNRAMVDVLETATGARRQPMLFYITTAGYDRNSVCWELHNYSINVLEGVIQDETWFAYIATVDEGDDWKEPKIWAKANPNLGVSVKLDDLERKCQKAKELPSAQNAFKQKHLNEWTEQLIRWIPAERWAACRPRRNLSDLVGERCYAGLDLGHTEDLSALVLCFKGWDESGEFFDVFPFFWIPEPSVQKRVKGHSVPYDVWVRQGFIQTTPRPVTDQDFIKAAILKLRDDGFDVAQVWYDPSEATKLALELEDAVGREDFMVKCLQYPRSLHEATTKVEELVAAKNLRHGENPPLRWMNNNVSIRTDSEGHIKIDKEKSAEKVDGMVALVMAIKGWIHHQREQPKGPFVYDDEEKRPNGFLTL